MYEEYKQAAYDTLSKLAPFTELVRRFNNNLSQINRIMEEDIKTGYSPKDISFNRYVKIDRTINFPDWLSLAFDGKKEVVLRSINISGSDIVLKTDFIHDPRLSISYPSVKSIIIFSFLDDYTWKRIMGNIRKLDSEYRRIVEYIYNIRDALREVFDREEKINEDYSDILHKRYDVDKRLFNIVANFIELALSHVDWASFTTTNNVYKDNFADSLLDTRIDLMMFVTSKNVFFEKKINDRKVSVPQEMPRRGDTVIKILNGIEVCNACITLYVTEEGSTKRYSNIPMTFVDYTSTINIRNLILAHYLLTDEDWQWIYNTMAHYLKLSEIAKKKINDAYTLIRLSS
ncbi:MAG: hypothetical protein JHC26_01850 [Thermofilum sp.]|jgi:hypothetical protein|uniref:hypothetical protein n=1 Tax=Thermofilum sp. TaxID=1961369 RepID=UPI002585D9CD|nr:hypothetical protein [Thermofilum sp.]MCI4407806.1 hypothetical protein [Thermofilum sp.]